jgi:uncharacterized protein YjbJ (UPF0337 family)
MPATVRRVARQDSASFGERDSEIAWTKCAWGGNAPAAARSVVGTMKSSTHDRMEGTAKELKGAAKQQVGKATDNPGKHAEGTVDRVEGKIEKAGGAVKKQLGH